MDEDRTAGTTRDAGGEGEEARNPATVDMDGAAELAATAQDTGSSFEQFLRDTIEQKPYRAVGIALGIGWLLGRTHRPL